MPEAAFHVFEAIVARNVREIELSDISFALVTERQAFASCKCCSDTITCATGAMIATLRCAELQLG